MRRIRPWVSERERSLFIAATAFLEGRLEEREVIDWALMPRRRDLEKRAIAFVVDRAKTLNEPWRSAWRLIEEHWAAQPDDVEIGVFGVKDMIEAGEISGALISRIVELVRPRLELASFTRSDRSMRRVPKRPKTWRHLFTAGITSGDDDLGSLTLSSIKSVHFLKELANRLDEVVQQGMDLGRRLGWDEEHGFWRLGDLHRVYFVPAEEREPDSDEPDRYHRGIAPSVKLLFAVASRLSEIAPQQGRALLERWRANASPIHIRLWAAGASRMPTLVSGATVADELLQRSARQFWNVSSYPELAEARSGRFKDFPDILASRVIVRVMKGPPASFWPSRNDRERVQDARRYWTARELRRIQLAGGSLTRSAEDFLSRQISAFADLADMRVDEGFSESARADWVKPNPDRRFDALVGAARLEALQTALTTGRRGWDDDPAGRATDWIRDGRHCDDLVSDFEATNAGATYPSVWEAFAWGHSIPQGDIEVANRLAQRVTALILQLPEQIVRRTIEGLSYWASTWQKRLGLIPDRYSLWQHLWSHSVEATNAQQDPEEPPDLNIVATSNNEEPSDLDTLNTPTGRLVGVFLEFCPNLAQVPAPFQVDQALRLLRDAVVSAPGRSGLIGLHRLIEFLPYFLSADRTWASEKLLGPLRADNHESIILWRAVARRVRARTVIEEIGALMADRATDRRLGRESRQWLAWILVVDCLHSYWRDEQTAVPKPKVQQMLRSVDDDVRSHAVDAVRRFVLEMQAPTDTGRLAPEQLFRKAVRPFLREIWPQERTVTSVGVAKALADLPATCGGAFAEAVQAVEPFLVPFDCWSLLDFGLYGDAGDQPKLAMITNRDGAEALLKLLDACVSDVEGAVIPMDLNRALEHVAHLSADLRDLPSYRRLAALARR